MVDWYGAKRAGQWTKIDKVFLIPIVMVVVLLIMSIYMLITAKRIIVAITAIVMIPAFVYVLSVLTGVYKLRKGMLIKVFSHDNNTTIRVIENALRNNGIRFKKSDERKDGKEYISKYPLKYAEIFEISDNQSLIKIQQQIGTGSIVELGPVTAANEFQIDNMKKMLDEAFQPKGL